MKLRILAIFVVVTLILALSSLIFGFVWWQSSLKAPSTNAQAESFVIAKGAGATTIARNLEKEGFIKNALVFRLYTRIKGVAAKIPPGEFRLTHNMSVPELVTKLMKGPDQIWVTIPEGLRREQIALKFADSFELEGSERETFIATFMQESQGKEGYLYPDTYLFPREATATAVVNRLTQTFATKFSDAFADEISQSEYSLEQLVTLASLIERETKTAGERPGVAGVMYNRMSVGMPLQIDATVQYALATSKCVKATSFAQTCDWWPTVYRDDYQFASPYNTYKISGLPPHAISNPGLTALSATLEPQSHDYYYYIHDTKGQIYFAQTLDEHNQNVAQYLR